jgi:lipoprotein-anchoring transpeptidase ErfK/SrfK
MARDSTGLVGSHMNEMTQTTRSATRWAAAAGVALLCAALVWLAPPAWATTVTTAVQPAATVYGQSVTVAGTVDPAVAGQQVTIALDGTPVSAALTDVSGAFTATITALAGGAITATLDADGTAGPSVALRVVPGVATRLSATVPFGRSTLVVRVAPATYDGRLTVRIWHHSQVVARMALTVRDARTVLRIPTPGIGRFRVELMFAADGGLAARTKWAIVDVPWRRLAVGSSGADVKALLTRLAWLRIRIPAVTTRVSTNAADAIVAFQKAYKLPRTYVFGGDDWRTLDLARRPTPRFAAPALHIEIDKTRQILMVIKDGAVAGVLAVSTGAAGNTPEGSFSILRKNLYTTPLYGSGTLFCSMTFYGNFAIHGYPEVPAYPASHGCVREPEWVADWTYDQSVVGERVYVYH